MTDELSDRRRDSANRRDDAQASGASTQRKRWLAPRVVVSSRFASTATGNRAPPRDTMEGAKTVAPPSG